jgi:hypothetical protein
MMPASLIAEAVRASETVTFTRERLAASDHVARNYRALALPALVAATHQMPRRAQHRRMGPSAAR